MKRNSLEMKKQKIYSESCVVGTEHEIIKTDFFLQFEWIVSFAYKHFYIPILMPDTAARQAGREAESTKLLANSTPSFPFQDGFLEIYFWFLLPWYDLRLPTIYCNSLTWYHI